MRRAGSFRLLVMVLIACIAVGGVLAATGLAEPAVQSAASLAGSVKKALNLGKSANRKASRAMAVARRAEKAAVTGKQGPAGPAGSQGERGAQGAPGANGSTGSNGSNGSPGATGPAGATGATGPQGTTGLWAVIADAGIGANRVRGTSSGQGKLGNGTFWVSFAPTDVSGCAYIASIGSADDQNPPDLHATVQTRPALATDVVVRTFNNAGVLTDPGSGSGFHVAVLC